MTTRLTHDSTYHAPLPRVQEMLRDPDFREQVCERQRVLRHSVEVTDGASGPTITVTQVQKVRKVPAVAAKLVGEEVEVTQVERWHSPVAGDVEISVPHLPASVGGTVGLREDDGVTVRTIDLRIKVSVPLVGSKLEALVSDLFTRALEAEAEVGRDYLAD